MVPKAHMMLGRFYSPDRQFEDPDWRFRKCLAFMDNNRRYTKDECEVYLAEKTLSARWIGRYAEVLALFR